MNSRSIVHVAAVLCVLTITAEAGQIVAGNLDVSDGPTPFIRFVHTRVDDVAGFKFAQFRIFPKSGSATRPIKAHYARSYLEARGYFDSAKWQTHHPDLRSLRWPPKPRQN